MPAPAPSLALFTEQFARLLRLARPEWPTLARAAGLSFIATLLSLTTPWFVKGLFDSVYPSGNMGLMHILVLGFVAASVLDMTIGHLYTFLAFGVRVRLRDLARVALFSHVLRLPTRTIEAKRSGEISARFKDVQTVLDTSVDAALQFFSKGLYVFLIPPILLWLDWRLALLAFASVPLTALLTGVLGTLANRHWMRTYAAYDEWSAFRVEALRHARTFKAMALEPRLLAQAEGYVRGAHGGTVQAMGLWYLCKGGGAVIEAIATAGLTYLGWRFIIAESLSLGEYVAFMSYAGLLLGPLRSLVDTGGALQKSSVSMARLFEYVDLAPEHSEAPSGTVPTPIQGGFQLRDVTFAYESATALSIRALDIGIGEHIALVGPSGSGKSTLLRLLARLEHPTSGRFLADTLDGPCPLHHLDLRAYRQQLAVCWQEPALLSGTLRDNLLLALDEAPHPAAIAEALRVCALDDKVARLPKGLDTPLSESGATLSAGERQRLALARTLLRAQSPSVRLVLLDEVTSNLDATTAAVVMKRMLGALRHKTVVMVTHNLAHAPLADRTLTIEQGQLISQPALHGDSTALALPDTVLSIPVP